MNNLSISKEKWLDVYNSIVLLNYFRHEYENNMPSIDLVNSRFNDFCAKNRIVGENFRFEGGTNAVSFCYLIIVRIHELVNTATGSDGAAKHELYRLAFTRSGLNSFDELTDKYEMQLASFSNDQIPDANKLYRLFKHLRHSVSHFKYKVVYEDNSVHFRSIDPKSKRIELDMSMPMAQLLNLTADFGSWVNNTLHEEGLLTEDTDLDLGT